MGGFTKNVLAMGIPFDKFVHAVKLFLIFIFVLIVLYDLKSIYTERQTPDAKQ